jgi:hypothetical protein
MKKLLLLAILAGSVGCGSDNPPPPQSSAGTYRRPQKSAPSVQGGRAEDFRAVEKPSTYSGDY